MNQQGLYEPIECLLHTPLSRRALLRLLGAGATGFYLSRVQGAATAATGDPRASPIDRSLGETAPRAFSGDQPERPHRALWDKRAYLAARGGLPPVEKSVPLVVVGGGIAGLTTAYLLRRHGPVVLEQGARFGGNARGESWRGLDYAIGAAYFTAPEEGSPLRRLYGELGVDKIWRKAPGGHPVALEGRLVGDFWQGRSAPADRAQFRALARYFHRLYQEEGGLVYPEIPAYSRARRRHIDALDRISFRRHVESVAGGPLHPHLVTAFEHYCWSSFGASFSEVSAAAGLNFFAAEFGDILVTPGGNAAIAERLYARLDAALPPGHLQAGALVVDVRVAGDGVEVSYEDAAGALHRLRTRAAVLACPKFVAARLVDDLEPERLEAIRRLSYRAYLVANVLLTRKLPDSLYDLYLLGGGATDDKDIKAAAERQKATDVVFGTYAHPDARSSILTLYRPLPYDGARPALLADDAYDRYRAEFEAQLQETVLPLLDVRPEDVADLRLARWGHPLPVAATGLIADGTVDRLRRPLRDRVFFVQQDNWALPAIETATAEALHWAPRIARLLA
ncbi:MAG: FAD-dependent oxidoreductase [Pseudomonadota bacterium]|jgi:hypothetical protein